MPVLLTEAPTTDPQHYRVSVEQFDRMVEGGAFPPDARVELFNGELVEMSPIGPPHDFLVAELGDQIRLRLHQELEGRAVVRSQSTLRCGEMSQLQPDITVLHGPHTRYIDRHPAADDTLLVVEVADSSLRYDLKAKVPLYGRLGIPEAWVVDLPHRRIHVHTQPEASGYGAATTLTSGDTLVPTRLPDVKIAVGDLRLDRIGRR
jgi:Uma2 family endonuclease